jgi:hypothetical protein
MEEKCDKLKISDSDIKNVCLVKTMKDKCKMPESTSHPRPSSIEAHAHLVAEGKCKKVLSTSDLFAHGAELAAQLTKIEDIAKRWKVLSDFWAEMMLYIAPSCADAQARAHLEALARGGEFITHLWALLTHAGVLGPAPIGPLASV